MCTRYPNSKVVFEETCSTCLGVHICIVDEVAKQIALHCDLFPLDVIFLMQADKHLLTGVCDWGSIA